VFPLDRWELGLHNLFMNKNPPFANGYYYHIYNRGVEKRNVFLDKWDYSRFLQTLDFYRKIPLSMKLSDYRRKIIKWQQDQREIVRIHCYCLMPNHFHLLIQQLEDIGITNFLKKITNSYTRYFNTKYERIGPLFQGSFKAKLIETDEYLLQVSKYIHRNPFNLETWKDYIYPYSSYRYFMSEERSQFCNPDFILSYFSQNNPNLDYRTFIEESEIDDPILYDLFIDPDE